jgi:hypothetical protein
MAFIQAFQGMNIQTGPVFLQKNNAMLSAVFTPLPFTSVQTAGHVNIVMVGWIYANASPITLSSVTDSSLNSYVVQTSQAVAGVTNTVQLVILKATGIAAAAANANSVKITMSTGTNNGWQFQTEVAPVTTETLTGTPTTGTTQNPSTSITSGTANELVLVGYVGNFGAAGAAAGAGFTSQVAQSNINSSTLNLVFESIVQSSAGAFNATATDIAAASSGVWALCSIGMHF